MGVFEKIVRHERRAKSPAVGQKSTSGRRNWNDEWGNSEFEGWKVWGWTVFHSLLNADGSGFSAFLEVCMDFGFYERAIRFYKVGQ